MFYLSIVLIIIFITIFTIWAEEMLKAAFWVPFVRTPRNVIDQISGLVEFKTGDIVYDLGAGDGRLLINLKNKFPDIICKGYEFAWLPYFIFWFKNRKEKVDIEMKQENFLRANLGDAKTVFCYLLPKVNKRLTEKFRKELKPGAKIISRDFRFEDRIPLQTIDTDGIHKLYIYEV